MRTLPAIALVLLVACPPPVDVDPDPEKEDRHAFDEGRLAACSGEIAWQTFTWQESEPEATFLWVTGRSEYTDKYHHLIPMLGDRPWNVILFDHHGQGRSDGIRAHAEDFDAQHVCDLGKIIEELADPDLPLGIVAHSMGGMIATRFAQLNPDVADALVVSAPLFRADFGTMSEADVRGAVATQIFLGNAEEPHAEFSQRPPCEDNVVTHDCELYEQFYRDPITEIGPATWGWLDAKFRLLDDFHERLDEIPLPILLHEPEAEVVVDPAAFHEVCDALNQREAGGCQLITWEDMRHELFNEIRRDEIMAETLSFLEERFFGE